MKVPYVSPAHKMGEDWLTTMQHRLPTELTVHHAADGRNALIYISRDAELTLMYQIEIVWHSISTKLEDLQSSSDVLSHAAFGEQDDHLLLITHDLSRRFRLYKIMINWNSSQRARQAGQPPITVVSPSFDIGRLTFLEHVAPQQHIARLSLLRIIPPIPDAAAPKEGENPVPTVPTIFAIFTIASLPADPMQQPQELLSVIARWNVEAVTSTLHPAFAKLKTNGINGAAHGLVTTLRRHEDNTAHKLILSVDPQYFNTMIAFVSSDATIDFWERISMTPVQSGDMTTASSLPQASFEHVTSRQHHVHAAMSGDGSALALIDSEHKLTHSSMALLYEWRPKEEYDMAKGWIEAAVVCLARQYVILTFNSTASDESLALLPFDLTIEMRSLYMREIFKIMGRQLDISMLDSNRQTAIVMKDTMIVRALSAQLITGTHLGTTEWSHAGKFAYAFLNMRLVCSALVVMMQDRNEAVRTVANRPDVLTSMRGLARWGSDLLIYIVDSLISAKRDSDPMIESTATHVFERFVGNTDNPVMHLLIFSFARSTLRFLAASISRYMGHVKNAIPSARSALERQQLIDTFEMGISMPFKYETFEGFIAEIDSAIRNAYTHGNVGSQRRSEIEIAAIGELNLPDELQPACQMALDTTIPKLMNKIDGGKVYFWDTSWLGIVPTPASAEFDVIRKLPLDKNMKLRVCRRCGAKMEDVVTERMRELPPWLAHAQRHCVCANYWLLD